MPRRSNRVIFLVLTLTALSLYWGCTQPEDVISDVTSTQLTLVPERLPSLPDGMVYELWVTAGNDSISLGKFSYDQENRVFLDANTGTPRADGGVFTFDDDLLKQYYNEVRKRLDYYYNSVIVTVETDPDDNGASTGPTMLSDAVSNPSDDPIEMIFQTKDTTLGDAVVRYNLESVSDASSDPNGVGRGIWFSAYQEAQKDLPDTLHYTVTLKPDTVGLQTEIIYNGNGDSVGVDTLNLEQLSAVAPRAILDEYVETTDILFGADTIYLSATPWQHIRYEVEYERGNALTPPYVVYDLKYKDDAVIVDRTATLHIFSQDEYNLPDYIPWGWHYKGWVVTSTGRTISGTKLMDLIPDRFTPPAWPYNSSTNELIPGDDGALITTGLFDSLVNRPDLSNPFVLNSNLVPQYPGEDFLNTDSLQAYYGVGEAFDLLPASDWNLGTAFISLEPNNFHANTNFPLIPFGQALPHLKSQVTGQQVAVTMRNWTSVLRSDLRGFPKITIQVERF